jgi:hypothetical protein
MSSDATEANVREPECFVGRSASSGEVGRFHFYVEAHLVLHIVLEGARANDAKQPAEHQVP